MKVWKAAVAALAMVVGAAPAWAVRIVRYEVSGFATITTGTRNPLSGGAFEYTTAPGTFSILMEIDADPTAGANPPVQWFSDGVNFSFGVAQIFESATFTSNSISASYSQASNVGETNWRLSEAGAFSETRTLNMGPTIQTVRNIVGTVDFFRVSSTSLNSPNLFVRQVAVIPEPATWGLMVVGACAAGSSLRSRRRKRAPSYS